ncbi:MAG: AmmeMemoRadiSam system radical SAM enzyme [Planctomycetota bacterium]
MKEAYLYETLDGNEVHCHLCAHHCRIADGNRGICQVRENQGGTLYTLAYGRTIARHVDPIEKKPLYHFRPGSLAYSIATPGCNFRCRWCQNWSISQMPRDRHVIGGEEASPDEIVSDAREKGCRSIAYTYTEPTIFFEYACDAARLAHDAGLANLFVTNGYMTEAALETIHPYLDAANVDVKGFRDETYRKYTGARLGPVLDSLRTLRRLGIWLEVTTLVIPEINDDTAELEDMADFVASELGPDTPWHISRFFPAGRMTDVPPTPPAALERAAQIGREAGLRYVYGGNVADEVDTRCPDCGRVVLRRRRFEVLENTLEPGGLCPDCGGRIAGVDLAAARGKTERTGP